MGKYSMDMSQESETMQEVFDEGWHDWEIVNMEEQTSKQGNNMFKISVALADDSTRGLVFFAVSEPKKRWFLKTLLEAVGCKGSENGVYDWEIDDVMGHTVSGRIENVKETWEDKYHKKHETTKSKIVEFALMGVKQNTGDDSPV